ncbi:MAG: DNA/RNA nuclease SfsA [Clostridiales bacterium]|nr:DNA/RNA nuclease SfsA [Clostridiales bacterium]
MKYQNTVSGKFISRPNRFVAQVEISGQTQTVHVKNTGRCKELLLPGAEVILTRSDNPARKTKYDLIAVYKPGLGLVNIDSQAPNTVMLEWLKTAPAEFPDITKIKPEFVYGRSRFDFYVECGKRKILIEVKGCTLEIDSVGYFPDAPTQRGVKHLEELARAVEDGYECFLAFVIAMPGVTKVLPNMETHPQFGEALDAAVRAGVKILYLPCRVEEDSLKIEK